MGRLEMDRADIGVYVHIMFSAISKKYVLAVQSRDTNANQSTKLPVSVNCRFPVCRFEASPATTSGPLLRPCCVC